MPDHLIEPDDTDLPLEEHPEEGQMPSDTDVQAERQEPLDDQAGDSK